MGPRDKPTNGDEAAEAIGKLTHTQRTILLCDFLASEFGQTGCESEGLGWSLERAFELESAVDEPDGMEDHTWEEKLDLRRDALSRVLYALAGALANGDL